MQLQGVEEELDGLGLSSNSLSPKLLGILLVAQQFTTASAEGLCHAFNSLRKDFDLIGLISAFGTTAATKSLSYSALNDGSFYLTGHIGPGSLSVAAALFEATGFRLAHLLALGGMGDTDQLVQLDCRNGLYYIGLKSNTECSVDNAAGASIVREHQSLWKHKLALPARGESTLKQKGRDENNDPEVEVGPKFGRRVGRCERRQVKLIILEVKDGRAGKKNFEVSLRGSKGGTLLLGWLPLLLTLIVIASCFICQQRFVGGLIILGTVGMMVAVLGLRLCLFKYSEPEVAEGAPEGDCLVVDDTDASILHIIKGKEESIQALFQRKIVYQASLGNYVLFLAGGILYVYVVASVLYMPNVSTSGQIHFAIANLIGLVADVAKASLNGKLSLAKKACEQFQIDCKDCIVFLNRTAAVACVAKHVKDQTILKWKKLLPIDGPVWQKWWRKLEKCDCEVDEEDADNNLLKRLLSDMRDGLTEPIRD